jgi:hypothetical protein
MGGPGGDSRGEYIPEQRSGADIVRNSSSSNNNSPSPCTGWSVWWQLLRQALVSVHGDDPGDAAPPQVHKLEQVRTDIVPAFNAQRAVLCATLNLSAFGKQVTEAAARLCALVAPWVRCGRPEQAGAAAREQLFCACDSVRDTLRRVGVPVEDDNSVRRVDRT